MKPELQLERTEKHLNKIFGSLANSNTINVSFILAQLDLNIKEKTYSKYSLESILKFYIYKKIKGLSNYYEKLINHFKDNPKEALQLGFLKDENNNILFLPKRTYNHYLQTKVTKEQLKQLDFIAEKILRLANKNKILLDIEVVKKILKNKKKSTDRIFKETIKLVKKLIYPQVKIPMKHNSNFTTKNLLDILVHVALTHDFGNNGTKTFRELYPNKKVPSGDTLLYHFGKLKARDELEQTFKDIFDVIFNFAKKNYKILQRRKLDIAIDIHNIPYYGNKIDSFVIGGKQDRGTNQFFKFITCSIVTAGKRFILDAIPIHPFDNLDDLVDRLIKRAKSKIKIRYVYLDRGFDNSKIITVLKKNNVKYLMPKVRSPTVKQQYDKSEDCKARVIKDFRIGDETTNLILVDDKDGVKRAFSTNIKISEPIAHYLFRFYSKRWGIETSYRNLDHDFKARTTSKNYNIRLFYFLFSICLYNLWILVNICVSLSLYKRLSEKPLITTKLFAIILYRVSIDPGG